MTRLLLFVLLVVGAAATSAQTKLTTFILVRHAEKANDGTNDPPLTPEGQARATRLAQLLEKTTVAAIYSTPYKRTRDTAAPLSSAKQLPIVAYDPAKKDEVLSILNRHAGATVVVVGHSNTIPRMANTLTNSTQFSDYADTDFANILVITVTDNAAAATVTWLRY